MRVSLVFAILAVSSASLGAQPPSDAVWQQTLLLSRVKRHVKTEMKSLPDYTCLATFDRFNRKARQTEEHKFDTVRVEVAYVGGKELYSWPGEGKFSDTSLATMVGVGMMGDGGFATHAHNLFVSDNGIEAYVGEEPEAGRFGSSSRKLVRWDYKISTYLSGWTIRQEDATQLVGAAGSFWVDAQTLDLVRIQTHGADFMESFPVKSVESAVDYERLHIGDRDVVLPVRSELTMIKKDGSGGRNLTEYSGCRQYTGQSTITFGAPPEPTPAAAAPPKPGVTETRIPAGLLMQIRLTSDLKLSNAMVGDLVEGTLAAALHDGQLEIAPKGATVRGRIRLLTRSATGGRLPGSTQDFAEMGLDLDEVEFKGHLAHFTASLKSIDNALNNVRMTMLTDRSYTDTAMTRTEISPAHMQGASVFFIEAQSFGLPKGTLMTWSTK